MVPRRIETVEAAREHRDGLAAGSQCRVMHGCVDAFGTASRDDTIGIRQPPLNSPAT
jgi:hypothetical protein